MEFLTYNDLITNKYLGDNTLPFNAKGLIALMISCNCAMAFEKIKEYSCEFKKELLKNPEVKAEYDALEPEFNIIQAMIDARKQQNLTQEELSKRTGITQADISRIENGTRNPSLEMVKRLAKGLGMQLKLELVPQVKKM
jgi:DNA-binding XRE family transcriptional regulator